MQPYESWVERRIREAQERGEFDNLPGAGKPIEGLDEPHDEGWWIKGLVRREGINPSAVLPPSMALRREREDLMNTLSDVGSQRQVREILDDLNQRIRRERRRPSPGHYVHVATVDLDAVVEAWRERRTER